MSEGYVGQRSGFSKTISEPQISFMNSSYQRKLCFEQRLLILIIRSLLISESNFDVPPASFDHIHRETCCAVITLILSRFHIYWSDRFCGQTSQRERLIESQIFAFTFIPLSFLFLLLILPSSSSVPKYSWNIKYPAVLIRCRLDWLPNEFLFMSSPAESEKKANSRQSLSRKAGF